MESPSERVCVRSSLALSSLRQPFGFDCVLRGIGRSASGKGRLTRFRPMGRSGMTVESAEAGGSCGCTEVKEQRRPGMGAPSPGVASPGGVIPGRRLAWRRVSGACCARNTILGVAPAAALARIGRALHGGADTGDEQLVALVGAGDDRAFEEIVDRYGSGLLSFCVHMLGSREWGEDALQLTLTSAYQALSRGRRPDALRPWLYTIARNRCLSELRSLREYCRQRRDRRRASGARRSAEPGCTP